MRPPVAAPYLALGLAPAVALALAVAGCDVAPQPEPDRVEAPVDSAAGEVAFELIGPNDAALVVPASINGAGPFDFVLDTGATLTCLDQALADSLALPDAGGSAFGAGVASQGRVRLVELDSMSVGAASAVGMPACVIDLSTMQQIGIDVDGLVGLNFLRTFRVTLDFQRNVLHLR